MAPLKMTLYSSPQYIMHQEQQEKGGGEEVWKYFSDLPTLQVFTSIAGF